MTINNTQMAETTAPETNNETTLTAVTSGFESLGIPAQILAALTRINFTTPTPIQAETIPLALGGRDILGTAQTGTGKTAAFTIPMLAHLVNNKMSTALIVAPTRELASQIQQAVMQMEGRMFDIRTALLIGGDSMGKQMDALRRNPRVIIGTPGRINDHLKRRSVNLSKTDYLVLDETDRMLDMGFGIQIDNILTHMNGPRQTMLFSATLPPNISKLAQKYMNDPMRISVGSTSQASVKITQETVKISQPEKYAALIAELDKREGTVIVFVKTKRGVDRVATRLEKDNMNADAIHGDLRQSRRDSVIRNFRNGKTRILVATDVAARGLDIPHIQHVINYDLPQCPEDYIHRIGRTGRNGAEGFSLSMISPEESDKWRAIERLMNPGEFKGRDNEDRPRGKSGKGFNNKRGGGFKHKRKEWEGPRRHRRNDEEQVGPNKGRYVEGEAAPQRNEARKEGRFEGRKPERKFDNRNEGRPEGRRPERSFVSNDRQPRENRDRWGNSDRNDNPHGARPEYRPEGRSDNGGQRPDNGFKKPFKKRFDKPFEKRGQGNTNEWKGNDRPRDDRPRDDRPRTDRPRTDRPRDDRPREDRPNTYRGDKPRFERDRNEGDRPRYQGNKRPFNKEGSRDGNRDGAPRGDKPWNNRPKDGERKSFDGDRPAFKKGGFKKSFGGGKPKFDGKPGGFKKRFGGDRPAPKKHDAA